ncbi:unnamed protein product [Aphanomyces euteiches]
MTVLSTGPVAALSHAVPGLCGCLAVGSLLSTVRGRRVQGPTSIFVALGVGCGLFRYINYRRGNRKSKLAAWVASVVVFRLCSDAHKHILLSYACVETIAQLYAQRRLPWLAEQFGAMVITARLVYTNLVHPEWMLPTHLRMMDHQSSLSTSRLQKIRQNLQTSVVTRCESLHPSRTCGAFATATCLKLVRRSAEIFIPLHLLSIGYTTLVKKKSIDTTRSTIDFGHSLAFMTASYMLAYSTSCLLPQRDNIAMIRLTSLTPFLAQYLEPSRRRTAILKAVACYSLISVFYQVKSWSICRRITRRGFLQVASLVYASFMTYVLQHPEKQNRFLMEYLYGYKMETPVQPLPSSPSSSSLPRRPSSPSPERRSIAAVVPKTLRAQFA